MADIISAPVPVAQLVSQALYLQQAGDLQHAEALYRRALKLRPNQFDALHNLGVCRHLQGDFREALKLIDSALKVEPGAAMAHINRGNALRELKRTDESLAAYGRAIALAPQSADAQFNLASALEALGRNVEALTHFDLALRLWPADPLGHSGRANVLLQLGRLDEAVDSYRRAVALDPQFADAYSNLGAVLLMLNRLDEALRQIDQALSLKPQHADALANRGMVLMFMGDYVPALRAFNASLSLDSSKAVTWHRCGQLLIKMRHVEDALRFFQRAAELAPTDQTIAFDRAVALGYLGQADQVLEISERLLLGSPSHVGLHINRGYASVLLGRFEQARDSLSRALELEPEQPNANLMVSLLDLLCGDYANGLPRYEWRFKEPSTNLKLRNFPVPRWTGREDLAGKTILVCGEQGMGDTLMFSRYLPLLAQRGARVVFEVQASVVSLLRRSLDESIELIVAGAPLPDFDFHAPLMSLPLAFGTTLESIPAVGVRLEPDPERVRIWRERLGPQRGGLRIGLTWSGNRMHGNDYYRSIALARLEPLMLTGLQFIARQTDGGECDQAALAAMPSIKWVGNELHDFDDTAALVALCDLVVSVDTSAVHLAGMMGKPVWALLPYSPDWRWLLDRDDSPWYPGMRLFRQAAFKDWDGVIQRIAAELSTLLERRRAGSPEPALG